jgi:Inner membrane protein YgaP-like, transmembrane domain
MTIDRIVLAFAGTVVLLGLLLGVLVNSWWLLLAAFVGLNLLQSAFTGFCPLARILRSLGVKPGAAFC